MWQDGQKCHYAKSQDNPHKNVNFQLNAPLVSAPAQTRDFQGYFFTVPEEFQAMIPENLSSRDLLVYSRLIHKGDFEKQK